MGIRSSTDTHGLPGSRSRRGVTLATAFSLLLMALVAPIAQFGVLKTIIVPADAAATTANIAASAGLFQAAIAAFLFVAILDVAVAGGFYVLLQQVNRRLAFLVGSLRILYAATFAVALVNLVDAAQVVHGATESELHSGSLQAQVASSVASFGNGWSLALGVFGVHLVGLGALLFRLPAPRLLATLVAVAGAGYLADSVGTLLIADYGLTVSTFTFVGEALLIIWLLWRVATGSRASNSALGTPANSPAAVAS